MNDRLLTELDRVDPIDRERIRATALPDEELAAILATPLGTEAELPGRRRTVVYRVLPVAAAAAVLIVAAVGLWPGDDGGSASPDAASALESAAAVAAAESAPANAGEFAYSRVRQITVATVGDPPPYSYYLPATIESWVAPDGSGRVRETRLPIEWPGPRDKDRWRESGDLENLSSDDHPTTDRTYGPGELNGPPYEAELPPVRDLPTNPNELARVLEEERNESSASVPLNAKMFEYGTSVLLDPGASPEVRGAAYEVLAGIEGVELLGDARDPLERPGVEVAIETSYSGGPERYSLIYDPKSARALAYTERTLEPEPFIDSSLSGYTLLEESGFVRSVDERP
jgi:hypothetical protein